MKKILVVCLLSSMVLAQGATAGVVGKITLKNTRKSKMVKGKETHVVSVRLSTNTNSSLTGKAIRVKPGETKVLSFYDVGDALPNKKTDFNIKTSDDKIYNVVAWMDGKKASCLTAGSLETNPTFTAVPNRVSGYRCEHK